MYIIHLQLLDDANQLDHKTFLCEFISALLGRAAAFKYGKTRTAITKANKGVGKFRKHQRMSASAPSLPKARLLGKKEDHTVTIYKNNVQQQCQYCSFLAAVDRKNKTEEPHKVKRVARMCVACNVYLCKDHFNVYHDKDSDKVN